MIITAKKNGKPIEDRLASSKFPMQMGNTPHQLAIPTVTTSTTKQKKKSPGCHGWLPLNPPFMYFRIPQGYLTSSDRRIIIPKPLRR